MMNTATETKAITTETFSFAGSSVESQLSHRIGEDRFFRRSQYRDGYGYHWTRWTETTERPYWRSNGDDPALWTETGSGWIKSSYQPRVRLPR